VSNADVAWFIDGAYLFKAWQSLKRSDRLDYLKLRSYLETNFGAGIEDAYYFNADPDPTGAKMNAIHSALSYRPPDGPGIRVKLYWLQKKPLFGPRVGAADRCCTQKPPATSSSYDRKRWM
jgi:hypothetical protein